ncbi:CG31294 [Drosophila busckii]|uniref:CG31294 n=1 Tax=Drosophila busckii TaxID=30019 RepID=A0A0M3QY69_DROBS|nr:CG31294 [Drosophila busckii]
MHEHQHEQLHEDFLAQPSKVNDLMKFISDIANANKMELGNCEYRRTMYDKAIEFYSRGLDYITDTPVLFCNRALCYIKKRDFKRALMDLEHVLNDLDQKCLRAWLYKAGALKRLNNEAGFEECIDNARRFNRANLAYVDVFLEKMRSDF